MTGYKSSGYNLDKIERKRSWLDAQAERKQRMKVSSIIYTLSLIKSEIIKDTDPEVRFFILNEKGEKEQVFVDYISSAKEGIEILLE